jgi:diguanylate cyclase (GGDEF)-like protein
VGGRRLRRTHGDDPLEDGLQADRRRRTEELTLGIRARTAVTVAVTMVVLAVGLVLIAGDALSVAFSRLQRHDGQTSVQLVGNWMQGQAKEQARNAQSYGAWNATYRYMAMHDPRYVAVNLTDANLASIGADFFVLLDTRGRAVSTKFTKQASLQSEVLAYIRRTPALQTFSDLLNGVHDDIAALPDAVIAVGSTPIVTSQSRGPSRGTLVSGRFLDDEAAAEASSQIGETVRWRQPAAGMLDAGDLGRLRSGAPVLLQTNDGVTYAWGVVTSALAPAEVAAVMRAPVDPAIASQGHALKKDAIVGLAFFIAVSILALVVVLDATVLRRLSSLMARVRAIGEADHPGDRVAIGGRDEIGALARDINGMLEAIDRSRAQLVKMATIDPLTGVFNRRRFEEELARELSESRRTEAGGALLWFDLDDFKHVNDTFGHAVGDQVLVGFARLLRDETRAYTTLARIGGDEFVMLLPGAGPDEAVKAAERLLRLMTSRTVAAGEATVRLGASIGIAFFPANGETVAAVLAAADGAMYEAKRAGRGRVCVAADTVTA